MMEWGASSNARAMIHQTAKASKTSASAMRNGQTSPLGKTAPIAAT
jgi:hypothetical protein